MSDESPGRYDGVLISELGARVEMDQLAMQAWRAGNNVELVPEFDARLRAVAATNPQAAAANGLFNQGFSVVPIDEGGVPLTQPTRDPEQLASWWEAGGPYADRWPAVPCEQGGLFGLLVYPGAGRDWFVKAATVHEPSRVDRLMATLDRVTELGVPPLTGDDWDDEPQQPKPDEVRAPMDAKLWLVEDVPAHRAVMRAWTGPIRGRAGQAAMAAARPAEPRQLSAMVWSWPKGTALPVGRELRKGVESLTAIPAFGAELSLDGVRFRVGQVPALLSPPPDWLIAELRKFGGGS